MGLTCLVWETLHWGGQNHTSMVKVRMCSAQRCRCSPAKMLPPWGWPPLILARAAEVAGDPKAEKCLSSQQQVAGGSLLQVPGAPRAGRVGRRPSGPTSPHLDIPPGWANCLLCISGNHIAFKQVRKPQSYDNSKLCPLSDSPTGVECRAISVAKRS